MSLPLIAAHRGASGGNIRCNSWIAFEAALMQGADIIELDVTKSLDGTLFVFHPGRELEHLLSPRAIPEMTDREVRALRYANADRRVTEVGVSTLDEVLEQLKNRCLINIDKFPTCMAEIAQTVRRHGMVDQVIVKTEADEAQFRLVEQIAPDLPYMVFARREDDFSEMLKKRRLNYQGTEIIFADEACEVAAPAYTQRMHALGLKVWGDAIVFNHKRVLAAGHNDDVSVSGHPDDGWGWLMDLGVDMIQTDFPGMLRAYMNNRCERSPIL